MPSQSVHAQDPNVTDEFGVVRFIKLGAEVPLAAVNDQ